MKYPKIEVIKSKDTNKLDFLPSDLNSLCKFLDLPVPPPIESETEFLEYIKNIFLLLNQDITEINKLISKSKLIDSYKQLEQECDLLEINLANKNVQYEEIQQYKEYNVQDLEQVLNTKCNEFNDYHFESKHSNLLSQAYAFLNGDSVSKNVLNMFYYVIFDYRFVIEKNKLVNQFEGLLGNIFLDLLSKKQFTLSYMEKEFQIDKFLVLKIVYGLVNFDIVEFDKNKEILYLKVF